ncbi:hypothetical protein ABTM51_21390, partial [Acinetobacter baumannii]
DQILGVRRLQLTVYGDNPVARRMYLKHGFEIEGVHRDLVRRGDCYVDTLSMSRIEPARCDHQDVIMGSTPLVH